MATMSIFIRFRAVAFRRLVVGAMNRIVGVVVVVEIFRIIQLMERRRKGEFRQFVVRVDGLLLLLVRPFEYQVVSAIVVFGRVVLFGRGRGGGGQQ